MMYQTCYGGMLFYIVVLGLCIGAKAANTNPIDDEKVKKGTMDIYIYIYIYIKNSTILIFLYSIFFILIYIFSNIPKHHQSSMDIDFGQYIQTYLPQEHSISRYGSLGEKRLPFSKPLLSKNIGLVKSLFFDLIKRNSGRMMNNESENNKASYNQREHDMRMVKNLYFDLLKRGANYKDFASSRRLFEAWLSRFRADSMGRLVSSLAYNTPNSHLFFKSLNKDTPSLVIGKRNGHPIKMKSDPAMASRFQKPSNLEMEKMLYYSLFN